MAATTQATDKACASAADKLTTKSSDGQNMDSPDVSPGLRSRSPIDIALCEAGPLNDGKLKQHWATENQMLDTHRFYDKEYMTPNVQACAPPSNIAEHGPLHGTG
jgi:hypothetical protein